MVVVCSSERALDLRPVLTRINLIVDGDAGMLPRPGCVRSMRSTWWPRSGRSGFDSRQLHCEGPQRCGPSCLLQRSMTSTHQGWAARNVSFDRPAVSSSTSKGRSRRA